MTFYNVGILGMAAAVPKNTIDNLKYNEFFDEASVKEIVDKTGIKFRRFAPEGMCASDMCYAAANCLLDSLKIDRSTIDLLIFVSQTPDYRMPATSIILQDRLGLAKSTAAFDINLGCSGFVYGLSVIFSFMQTGGFRKALLLNGETRSRVYHPKDRKTAFLFGDGGTAALIECNNKYGSSFFSLNSDGSKQSLIKMEAGGYRKPSSINTFKERIIDDFGNISTDEHASMNGFDVFNFVLQEIPINVNSILSYAGETISSIDFFLFHQANIFMNDYLTKKLKIPAYKVPHCIEKFGNTSSVSIPLTIVSQLDQTANHPQKMLMCGFGVGMSWASCVLESPGFFVNPLIELV